MRTLIGFVFGISLGSAIAYAAVGDIIYQDTGANACITIPQANCYAQCAIADGSWDQPLSRLTGILVRRSTSCEAGFYTRVSGIKSAPAASLPPGTILEGVVTE